MYTQYGPLCAQVYEHTKPVGHAIAGDLDYYRSRLHNVTGPILEAGVGNGRLLVPFYQEGLKIEGIDLSADMLAVCQRNCDGAQIQPTLYQGDMGAYPYPHAYEAIIVPTGSFGLITDRQVAERILAHFYQSLQPNGRLILDLDLPSDWQNNQQTISSHELSPDYGITLTYHAQHINWIEQTTHSLLKYEAWQQGQLVATELQRFDLRWYGIEEFKQLLLRLGYRDIVVSADYHYGQVPSQNGSLITFEACK
ncbi:MAG: class I SAM-dependent methyltransferase [Neisseriaceae bacterium]|nr:class I SAM-dependent methyltransferase [Neisseriaceae bacterium]